MKREPQQALFASVVDLCGQVEERCRQDLIRVEVNDLYDAGLLDDEEPLEVARRRSGNTGSLMLSRGSP
jgi:hypothetical protein